MQGCLAAGPTDQDATKATRRLPKKVSLGSPTKGIEKTRCKKTIVQWHNERQLQGRQKVIKKVSGERGCVCTSKNFGVEPL